MSLGNRPPLVLDASVIFNLLGTGRAKFLCSHCRYRLLAPSAVVREIKREPEINIVKDADLVTLVDCGLIKLLDSHDGAEEIALALMGCPSPDDLDDGEAYAIAYAVVLEAAIGIDENKGRRIIATRWPALKCFFALEVIESAAAAAELSNRDCSDIVFSAVRHARMRVPKSRRRDVIELIGKERARECVSLGLIPD